MKQEGQHTGLTRRPSPPPKSSKPPLSKLQHSSSTQHSPSSSTIAPTDQDHHQLSRTHHSPTQTQPYSGKLLSGGKGAQVPPLPGDLQARLNSMKNPSSPHSITSSGTPFQGNSQSLHPPLSSQGHGQGATTSPMLPSSSTLHPSSSSTHSSSSLARQPEGDHPQQEQLQGAPQALSKRQKRNVLLLPPHGQSSPPEFEQGIGNEEFSDPSGPDNNFLPSSKRKSGSRNVLQLQTPLIPTNHPLSS